MVGRNLTTWECILYLREKVNDCDDPEEKEFLYSLLYHLTDLRSIKGSTVEGEPEDRVLNLLEERWTKNNF